MTKKKTLADEKSEKAITVEEKTIKGLALTNPQAFQELVLKAMPEFVTKVNNKEDVGNAMYDSAQEMMLAIEDVLIRYFEFSVNDLIKFKKNLTEILQGVKEYETHGLNILTPHSMGVVGEQHEEGSLPDIVGQLAGIRHDKHRFIRAGIEYPMLPGAKPFLKKLDEKNKGK